MFFTTQLIEIEAAKKRLALQAELRRAAIGIELRNASEEARNSMPKVRGLLKLP